RTRRARARRWPAATARRRRRAARSRPRRKSGCDAWALLHSVHLLEREASQPSVVWHAGGAAARRMVGPISAAADAAAGAVEAARHVADRHDDVDVVADRELEQVDAGAAADRAAGRG